MSKQDGNAARKVAKHLFMVENAVDAAAAEAGEFIATMLSARGDANLSAIVGQQALAHVAEGVNLLVQARSKFVDAHRRLDKVRTDLGLTEVAIGDLGKKPPFQPLAAERTEAPVAAGG